MATTTLIQGKVKYPARTPKDYGNGERINIVVTASTGEEIKLWGKPTDSISMLKKGESVQVIFDGKGHKLLESEPVKQAITSTPNTVTEWSLERKRAIANQITQNADLLAFCLQTAKSKFVESGLVESEDSMRSLATTLFIQAQKSI
jgi:predicted NAD-dependent protein-ADP-ribosyltransferase YbiA (DUF1768 family)